MLISGVLFCGEGCVGYFVEVTLLNSMKYEVTVLPCPSRKWYEIINVRL